MAEERIPWKCPKCGKDIRMIPNIDMRCPHCGVLIRARTKEELLGIEKPPSTSSHFVSHYHTCKSCGHFLEYRSDGMRCPNCGKEYPYQDVSEAPMRRPTTHSLRSTDPVRFRTGGGGFGVGGIRRDESSTWEVTAKRPRRKAPRQTLDRFPLEPEFEHFHNEKGYQIIVILPYHKDLEEVRCEVIDGELVIESLKDGFNFLQKFSLPDDVLSSSPKIGLKNAVLNVYFKKKRKLEKKTNSAS